MSDQRKTDDAAPASSFSEAERMAKIRELLVGPAIADQSERIGKSVEGLSESAREQQETIDALLARVQALEESQRAGMREQRMRLLGMMEALLADDEELRARLMRNEVLWSRLEDGNKDGDA